MPSESFPPLQESPPATWWTTFLLELPSRQQRTRRTLIVMAVVGVIGWLDYVAGFWLSLQLFYLIPILMAVAWLGWRWGCATATLCVVVRVLGDVAAGIFDHVDLVAVFWNRLAELCVYIVLVWFLQALLSLHRELEQRVRQRTSSLEHAVAARDALQKQLFEVSRRERSAIGHDLHDGLGQHLTATSIAANLLATRLATQGNPESQRARDIVNLVQEGIAKTRQIARGLLLSAVSPPELASELEELASRIRQEHGIACQFTLSGTIGRINLAASSHLFYIAQEAALNSIKHAAPTRIDIDLQAGEEDLNLKVTDNGSGIRNVDPAHPGMGLRIMEHRSELIGARFGITPATPRGTCVHCQLALATTKESSAA